MINKDKSNHQGSEKQVKIISCEQFANQFGMKIIHEGRGELTVDSISVNRPGLQFAGYLDHFANERVQLIGNAEINFLACLPEKIKKRAIDQFFAQEIPCLIVARGLTIDDEIIEGAKKYDCPLFSSEKVTTSLISEITNYLSEVLAPTAVIHGVMMDILGVGMLITGNAGIGKSETALELIERGNCLVADDSVIVTSLRGKLSATCPEKIRYFMEVRGVGIINVKSMFGPGAVRLNKKIDLIAELTPWNEDSEYDRLGDEKLTENILGVQVQKLVIPVSPGRNIPIILETAARKFRLEEFGYNAVDELIKGAFSGK